MEDIIDRARDEDELAHVAPDKVKVRLIREMGDVIRRASDDVVDSNDAEAFGEKAVGEMGAEESGSSCYNGGFLHRKFNGVCLRSVSDSSFRLIVRQYRPQCGLL